VWQVLQKARTQALTEAQAASPLARKPYDFRHAGVSWRLNAGTPATLVAEWAGHTVEVLYRIYAHCRRRRRTLVHLYGRGSWLAWSPENGSSGWNLPV
jgi:integrase